MYPINPTFWRFFCTTPNSFLSDVENNRKDVGIPFAKKVADALGYSIEPLILLIQSEMAGDEQLANRIKRLSPVAWQHISLHGNFIFSTNEELVDIKGIVNKLLTNFKDRANASNPYSIRAKGASQDKPVLSG